MMYIWCRGLQKDLQRMLYRLQLEEGKKYRDILHYPKGSFVSGGRCFSQSARPKCRMGLVSPQIMSYRGHFNTFQP